jgi:hypothetical protein
VVTHLTSMGVSALGNYWLKECASDLRIGHGANEAAPEQIRRIIDALLDDRPCRRGQHDGLIGERAAGLDGILSMLNGVASTGAAPRAMTMGGALGPVFLSDARLILVYETQLMAAADKAENMVAFRRTTPVLPGEIRDRPFLHPMANMFLPTLDRFVETDFRAMTDRHLTAMVLAFRWYATEHDGKLPARLEELVPKYLPVIPSDPMADGKLLNYIPKEIDPVVYSVGVDGIDQGASTQPAFKGARQGSWQTLDEVVHLKRQPRPAPDSDN